jgi:hypothetical protein
MRVVLNLDAKSMPDPDVIIMIYLFIFEPKIAHIQVRSM